MIYLIYGRPKSGKTTFGASFDNALIVDLEKGSSAHSADVEMPNTWVELAQIITRHVENPSRPIIIDSLTVAHKLAINHVVGALTSGSNAAVNGAGKLDLISVKKPVSLPQYGQANDLIAQLIMALRGSPYPVVLICQERVTYVEAANPEDSDVSSSRESVPDLPQQARQMALMYSDVIGYTEAATKESKTTYRMWLKPTEGITAGCRADISERKPYLINPTQERITRYLEGK